jgi:hypothetical protein
MITNLKASLSLEHAFLNSLQIVNIVMPSEYMEALIEAQVFLLMLESLSK